MLAHRAGARSGTLGWTNGWLKWRAADNDGTGLCVGCVQRRMDRHEGRFLVNSPTIRKLIPGELNTRVVQFLVSEDCKSCIQRSVAGTEYVLDIPHHQISRLFTSPSIAQQLRPRMNLDKPITLVGGLQLRPDMKSAGDHGRIAAAWADVLHEKRGWTIYRVPRQEPVHPRRGNTETHGLAGIEPRQRGSGQQV